MGKCKWILSSTMLLFKKKKGKRIYIQYVYLLPDGKVSHTICCKFYTLELNVINTNTC